MKPMKTLISYLILMCTLLALNADPDCKQKYTLTNAADFFRQINLPVNFKKTDNCILYPKVKQGTYPVIL